MALKVQFTVIFPVVNTDYVLKKINRPLPYSVTDTVPPHGKSYLKTHFLSIKIGN